jgi:catechol 2,3-dioxygenase-like lactoylglutathione lyase family enzyme
MFDPAITGLDHIVLTVKDVEATISFYSDVLGLEPLSFAGGRRALQAGDQKINLHHAGAEYVPHAIVPSPGSADFACEAQPTYARWPRAFVSAES